jgi:hypothetical protein
LIKLSDDDRISSVEKIQNVESEIKAETNDDQGFIPAVDDQLNDSDNTPDEIEDAEGGNEGDEPTE